MAIRSVEQENPDGMDACFATYHALRQVRGTLRNADLNLKLVGEHTESERAAIEQCEREMPEEAMRMLEEYIVNKFVVRLEKFDSEEEGSA